MKDITCILETYPRGTKLYSPLFGEVILEDIQLVEIEREHLVTAIYVRDIYGRMRKFSDTGRVFEFEYYYLYHDTECMLFFGKDNRDWDNKIPLKRKYKYYKTKIKHHSSHSKI